MAFSASTGVVSQANVDQTNKTVDVTLNGSWTITGGDVADYAYDYFYWSIDNGSSFLHGPFSTVYGRDGFRDGLGISAGTKAYSYTVGVPITFYTTPSKIAADKNCAYIAEVFFTGCNGFSGSAGEKTKTGSTLFFKSYAIDPTASAPNSTSITSSSATILCSSFFVNTDASTATAQLEYRVFGSGSGFTVAGASSPYSGYLTQSISRNITGLSGSTTYEFRLTMTRTTANSTTFTSSSSTFTTAAGSPTITTNSASNIGPTTATLNGTVNPNTFSTTYDFAWGTTLGGPYPNTTANQGPSSGSSPISFSAAITGLSPSTTYYYITYYNYSPGGTVAGNEVSFSTTASAAQAPLMASKYEFTGKYGVAKTFQFSVETPSTTNSDTYLSAAVPWIAGDVLVDKDGGGLVNIASLPTRIGSTKVYQLSLSASEMQAKQVTVLLTDVSGGPLWRDCLIIVTTIRELGMIDVDNTQNSGNKAGFSVIGVGTSPGILATGGATSSGDITGVLTSMIIRKSTATAGGASTVTLDANASATDNWYNNCIAMIVSGTGAGQFRIITGYVGSTKVATVHSSWNTNPAASSVIVILPSDDVWNIPSSGELGSLPTSTSKFSQFIQFLFQRFAYNRTQTSTTQTVFKADSSTSLASGTVSDNGTTQTSGKLA